MSNKSKNKRVGIGVVVVATCIVMAGLWAVLAIPGTALAGKPVKPDDVTHYSVTMTGDLTIVGAFSFDDGVCSVDLGSPAEGRTFEKGILVNRPLPAVCIANAFLDIVTLYGDNCDDCDGVIPHGNGPNWGTLFVEGDDNGVIVKYSIGETDEETGKCRRYTLSTTESVIPVKTEGGGAWPNGDGDDTTKYEVTIPSSTSWSLVQAKPGKLNTPLTSTQVTVITFTEYTGP